MEFTHSQIVSQKMALKQHLVSASGILETPLTDLDKTLERVLQDPDSAEAMLSRESKGQGKWPLVYTGIVKEINPRERDSKDTDRQALLIGDVMEAEVNKNRLATPDITYLVRGYGDFSISSAPHFIQRAPIMHLAQLPPKTRDFAGWLVSQKNWMISTLSSVYHEIGKSQSGFLVSLDPRKLVIFPMIELTEKLPYTISTYSRLLKNKTVGITTPEDATAILPVRFLLPQVDNIKAYEAVRRLNSYFEEEFREGTALGDGGIPGRIGERIARRTVVKYRNLAGIPAKSQREMEYASGRKEPFKIHNAIESYLPDLGKA